MSVVVVDGSGAVAEQQQIYSTAVPVLSMGRPIHGYLFMGLYPWEPVGVSISVTFQTGHLQKSRASAKFPPVLFPLHLSS